MKNPKKLTRNQKIAISNHGYDPKQYLLVTVTPSEMVLISKKNQKIVKVPL